MKEQNQPWVKANFCQSAGLVVQAAIPNPGGGGVNPGGGAGANPVNPNAIDLELQ